MAGYEDSDEFDPDPDPLDEEDGLDNSMSSDSLDDLFLAEGTDRDADTEAGWQTWRVDHARGGYRLERKTP